MDPTQEATAILTRLFEALARQHHKTLSAQSRADIVRACKLLTQASPSPGSSPGDFPPPPPQRRSPGECAVAAPAYERWRAQRRGTR